MRLLGIIRNNPAPYKKFRSALGHERPRPTAAAAAAVKKFSAKTFYPRLCWIAAEVKSLLGSLHNNEPKRMNEMDNVEGGPRLPTAGFRNSWPWESVRTQMTMMMMMQRQTESPSINLNLHIYYICTTCIARCRKFMLSYPRHRDVWKIRVHANTIFGILYLYVYRSCSQYEHDRDKSRGNKRKKKRRTSTIKIKLCNYTRHWCCVRRWGAFVCDCSLFWRETRTYASVGNCHRIS